MERAAAKVDREDHKDEPPFGFDTGLDVAEPVQPCSSCAACAACSRLVGG